MLAYIERYLTGRVPDEAGRLLQSAEKIPGNGTCTFEKVVYCKINTILDKVVVESSNEKRAPSVKPAP
jgi:hypothetical protein